MIAASAALSTICDDAVVGENVEANDDDDDDDDDAIDTTLRCGAATTLRAAPNDVGTATGATGASAAAEVAVALVNLTAGAAGAMGFAGIADKFDGTVEAPNFCFAAVDAAGAEDDADDDDEVGAT